MARTETKTTLKPIIAVKSWEWEELTVILRQHLPSRQVWAFGSRATGQRVKRFSDLDLAIGGEELPLGECDRLAEALCESRLPFKVDIVDLSAITPEFRARIEPEMVLVQK